MKILLTRYYIVVIINTQREAIWKTSPNEIKELQMSSKNGDTSAIAKAALIRQNNRYKGLRWILNFKTVNSRLSGMVHNMLYPRVVVHAE